MVNRVILVGNLGQDPEIKHLESGVAVAKFSLATNESYKDKNGEWQEQTEWHNIVAWRYLAERAEKSLRKGMTVYLEGKLTHRKYQDQDGKDRYFTEVVADTIRNLSRREGDGSSVSGSNENSGNYQNNQNDAGQRRNSGSTAPADTQDEQGDDLPF